MRTALTATILGLGLVLAAACGKNESHSDSQTHWLGACEKTSDCKSGLNCICSRCVAGCPTGGGVCETPGIRTACFASDSEPIQSLCGAKAAVALCLEGCTPTNPCGAGQECLSGACVPVAGGSAGAAGSGGTGNLGGAGAGIGGGTAGAGGAPSDCDCLLGAYRPACGVDGLSYDATCGNHCVPVEIDCMGECPCPAETSPGSVTLRLEIAEGASYCGSSSCLPFAESAIVIRDAQGRIVAREANPPGGCHTQCSTCAAATCPGVACEPGDYVVASETLSWDGTSWSTSTCNDSESCSERSYAPPGAYTAVMCASPGTLEGMQNQCNPTGAEECVEVPFEFPSDQVYTGTLGSTAACVGSTGSCAGGETCCSGLTCCGGVPVPAGAEYCSQDCPDSDRNLKLGLASVDTDEILERLVALPVSTWRYTTESSEIKHLGPMAQDFKQAFGLGSDERSISKVDADGVAFAAIQAVHARLSELEASNRKLTEELQKLKTSPR